MQQTKTLLDENDIPKKWYNILPDIYALWRQTEVFEAAVTFARSEGIVPAPESAHAIRCAIDKALECRKSGEIKTILFNLSGHGHFDMGAYDSYFSGDMKDLN